MSGRKVSSVYKASSLIITNPLLQGWVVGQAYLMVLGEQCLRANVNANVHHSQIPVTDANTLDLAQSMSCKCWQFDRSAKMDKPHS